MAGVVVGVGGILGMDKHDVLVTLDQIKFLNEPVRPGPAAPAPGTTTRQAPADATELPSTTATRPARAPHEK